MLRLARRLSLLVPILWGVGVFAGTTLRIVLAK
jgi:hypothetical protein